MISWIFSSSMLMFIFVVSGLGNSSACFASYRFYFTLFVVNGVYACYRPYRASIALSIADSLRPVAVTAMAAAEFKGSQRASYRLLQMEDFICSVNIHLYRLASRVIRHNGYWNRIDWLWSADSLSCWCHWLRFNNTTEQGAALGLRMVV